MTDWYVSAEGDQLQRLLAEWPEAPTERPETLAALLDVARTQVIAYALGLPDDTTLGAYVLVDEDDDEVTDIPARLVYAQLRQAENLWNAGRASSAGDMGMDSFTFTPRPLDKTIREIIRPRGVPSVA